MATPGYAPPGSVGSAPALPGLPPVAPAPPQTPLPNLPADFGVNPYTPTGYAAAAPAQNAAQVVNTLGIAVPAPGESTPEDLMANIQEGIAKLDTVNPELAEQMRQQYGEGADGQSQDEGGLLGALKDIGGAIVGGAGKAFELLGRSAHLIPALVDPESWEDGNPFDTTGVLGALVGKDVTNWNQVFQHMGWEGDGLSGAFRSALGLGADILTDPLTYAFGAGAGVSAAEKGVMAGTKTAQALATAEKAATLGLSSKEKMVEAIDMVIKTMGGEGVNFGKLAKTASADEAATILANHGAAAVGSQHRALIKDIFEAFDNSYNAVQARGMSKWLRKGAPMELGSGTVIKPSEVKELLDTTIKAGTNMAPKSAEWLAAKASAGVQGGIRFTPYIPFTKLRAIGPMLPFTNVVQPLAKVARFGAGFSSSKRMMRLIQTGEATWDDLATLQMHGFTELKTGANATLHTKELYEKIAQGGVARSAFYSASERAGAITAQLSPGAKQFRMGSGYYFAESKRKALKATIRDIQDTQMYDVVPLSEAERKAGAGYGKNKLYKVLEDTWGISLRRRKNTATDADHDLFTRFMDFFGGADDIPINQQSVSDGTFDRWFWAQPENAAAKAEAATPLTGQRGEILSTSFQAQEKAEAKLRQMKEVLGQVPEGSKRDAVQMVAKVQQRGADLLRSHGIAVRDVRYKDLRLTGTIAFEDKSIFTRGVGKDISEVKWYAKPKSAEGLSANDIEPDSEVGAAGIVLTTNPEGGIEVAANAQHPLMMGEATSENEVTKFLQEGITDEPVLARARAEAEGKVRALEAAWREKYPDRVISVTSPIHPDNIEETIANATMEVLKGRGGSQYDSIMVRGVDGQHKLIMLGAGDEVAPWEQVKLMAHGAPRVKTSQGYASRGFTKNLRAFLSGAPGGQKVIHTVKDLEARALRKTIDETFDEAELHAREVLSDGMRANGSSEETVAKLWEKDANGQFLMPLFERNPLEVHERYVNRVSEGVASAVMGDLFERMDSLGKLLPQRFSRVAAISEARMSIDDGVLNALERVGNRATHAFDRMQRQERKLHDLELKQSERRAEDIGAVLERWQAGEEVDLAALFERNPQLRRVIEASEDLGATLKAERDKIAVEREHLAARHADRETVEELLAQQLGADDKLVFKLKGDGQIEVRGWHGTNRAFSTDTQLGQAAGNTVPTAGPDAGTQFSANGLHLGPRRAAEDRIGSADYGMFDIVDDTTGEVVDTVEGRHVTDRIHELAQEQVDAVDPSTAGGQDISNYSAHMLETSDEEVEFLHDNVFPVNFQGKALHGKDGKPVIVSDVQAHTFGAVMQGKTAGVRVTWNADRTKIIHAQPLMEGQDYAAAKAAAPLPNVDVWQAGDLRDQGLDAVVYRNAVEGARPSAGTATAAPTGKPVDPFNDTGAGKPLSLLIFDNSVNGKVTSIREEVERMLNNGELGITKDGEVLTRAGKARTGGRGGARRVYSRQELDSLQTDLDQRASDLEAYARGENPNAVEGQPAYSNPGRAVKSKAELETVQARGKELLDESAAGERQAITDTTDDQLTDILTSLDEEWGGRTLDLKTGEFVERDQGFAGGIVPNAETITFPLRDLNRDRLNDAVIRAQRKWADELARPDVNLGIFRDDLKGTVTIEPSIVVAEKADAEAIATHLGAEGGFYDFATGNGVFPARVPTRGTPAEVAAGRVERAVAKQGRAVEATVRRERKAATLEGTQAAKLKRDLMEGTKAYNDIENEYQGLESKLRPAMEPNTTPAGDQNFMRDVDIPGLAGVRVHAYIADEMEWLLKDRPVGELRRAWKEFVLNPWKKWATYRSPGFHVRNAMGAWFNNQLGGVARRDYEFANRLMQARDGVSKWANAKLETEEFRRLMLHQVPGMQDLGGVVTYGHLADALSDMGMTRGSAQAVALVDDVAARRAHLSTGGKLQEKAMVIPRGYENQMRRASSTVEDYFRTAAWAAGMRSTSGDLYGARAFVMMRHGDYGDLTETEEFIKDLVPFYKWMRTNIPYQLRMLAEEPGKVLMVQKAQTAAYEGAGLDAVEYVKSSPDWMKQSLNIPLPWTKGDEGDPVQVLSLNLPIGDLYKGMREYTSAFLPVVSDILESGALKQDLFTGKALTGKMVPLGAAFNLPGLRSVLGALPGAQMREGQVYIPDTFDNVLSAVPVYGRFRNWLTGDPNRVERRWGALTSFFVGAGTRGIDLTADEQAFYYDVLEPTLQAYQSMGVVFPTKDQLVEAGKLVRTTGMDPNTMWPEGSVGTLPGLPAAA